MSNSTIKQGYLPLFISDCLDLLDPVFTFDRFMEGIDLKKYLKNVPEHKTGRIRYDPVDMLKTVIFGFMTSGYCSLRELEDNCRVNLRGRTGGSFFRPKGTESGRGVDIGF